MAQLEILRKSQHENIIKYIEWFTEDHNYGKHYFLVTDYYKVSLIYFVQIKLKIYTKSVFNRTVLWTILSLKHLKRE